jgi:hypothetical protein
VDGLTCFIYIYDDDTNKLFLKASSIKDARGLGLLSLRAGEGLEGQTLDSTNDVILVDRTEEGSVKRIYLSLPMLAHGRKVGTLNAQVTSAQGLSRYQESFLKDIRSLIAEHVYKFKQGEAEKLKSRRMFAVDEAGLEMISINDIKRLSTIIATTPAAIIGAEGSLLRLKQADSRKYQTAATFGLDDRKIREYFLPIEKETVMEVLRRKGPASRELSEEASPYIRSVLSIPLKVDEEIVGVLTFFNKTTEAYVYPCPFSEVDSKITARFAVYAEKALSRVLGHRTPGAPGEESNGVDVPPGIEPQRMTPLKSFEKKVNQELNRARRFEKNLVLATLRVVGLKDPAFKDRGEFENRLIGSIRKSTRSFDVVVKLNEETYGFLFLDTSEKITRLLESISELIASSEEYNKAFLTGKFDILYGYGIFPGDGDSFADLYSKAMSRNKLTLKRF